MTDAVELIGRRHPEYFHMLPKWNFWLDSYRATPDDYAKRYLFQSEKEGTDEFNSRCQRAFRENHSKHVVDMVNTYLFKEGPHRNIDNEVIKRFISNADGTGRSLTSMMKTAGLFASVLGRVYIVIDRKDPKQMTNTQLDNLNSQLYCYLLYPQDVLDISFDDFGNPRWALVKELNRDDSDPYICSGEMVEQYRLWMPNEWVLFDSTGSRVDGGKTGLGVVPVIPIDNEERVAPYYSPSLISDIAYIDRSIFNNYSRLDVIVDEQTFSQLIFPVEGAVVADVVDNPKAREDWLVLAANRVLFYSGMAGVKPEFISPDATQAEMILGLIQHQIKQLYNSIGLQNETSVGIVAQSGVSKSYDFDKLNKLLASKADNLENAERDILNIAAKWLDLGNDVEINVDYPDEFDVKSLAQEIMFAQELALLDISNTFMQEIYKRIVDKATPKLPKHKLKEIIDEIEKANYLTEDSDIQASINNLNSQNDSDDNFKEKKNAGKKGGRLTQEQNKFQQI